MHERRELLDGYRARNVPVRIDRVDDDERLREGPARRAIELDEVPLPPREAVLQHAAERAVLQHEEFAQVPAEAHDLRLRAVHADALRPRLQEPDLVRLAFLDPAEHVVDVERRAVDRAHPLRRVRDPIARDDLHLEARVPAARVRVLGVSVLPPLEDLAEGEAARLQLRAGQVRRERDEEIDLDPREMGARHYRSSEERLRLTPLVTQEAGESLEGILHGPFDPRLLLRRRPDPREDLLLDAHADRMPGAG